MYSLAGATLSLIVMVFVKNKIGFGQLGVSVAGGVSHNIGQLLVAIPATHTWAVVLLCSGADGVRSDYRTADWSADEGNS